MAQALFISDSEFYMWRAVFAFALADGNMSAAERALLNEYKANTAFSPQQLAILRDDFAYPHDVQEMYRHIARPEDKHRFCVMARALAWCDGDLDKQDEIILQRVSCLGTTADADILRQSRAHPDIEEFHERYIKSGVAGFMRERHLFEVRI